MGRRHKKRISYTWTSRMYVRTCMQLNINIKSYIFFSQDYEQQVAGVGQLVSKLSTETTNSTNDLETRLLVGFLELPKHFLFLRVDCRFFGFSFLWIVERISYSSDCSWKPHGFSRPNLVGEGGRGENVLRKGGLTITLPWTYIWYFRNRRKDVSAFVVVFSNHEVRLGRLETGGTKRWWSPLLILAGAIDDFYLTHVLS